MKQSWTMALVLGMSSVAGCQLMRPQPDPQAALPRLEDKHTKLSGSQIADVQVAVGRSLEERGDPAQAMNAYADALKQDPTRADASLRLAVLMDQQGKFSESVEMYRKSLAGKPGNPDIFCNMGYSLYLQNRFAEAEMNLRQALALAPSHIRAHNNLGLVLARLGRSDEAFLEFRRGGCSEADAHVNLAFSLSLSNNLTEARQHYQAALALDHASVPAKKGLKEIDSLLAKFEPKGGIHTAAAN